MDGGQGTRKLPKLVLGPPSFEVPKVLLAAKKVSKLRIYSQESSPGISKFLSSLF